MATTTNEAARQQRDEQQRHHRSAEDRGGREGALRRRPSVADHAQPLTGRPERHHAILGIVDEDHDRVDGSGVIRRHEHELVGQVAGVLDDADHGASGAVRIERSTDGEVEVTAMPSVTAASSAPVG